MKVNFIGIKLKEKVEKINKNSIEPISSRLGLVLLVFIRFLFEFFSVDLNSFLGTFYSENGEKYTGRWKDNKMEGWGCFEWPDGNKYIGAYKDNKKCGFGVLHS